MERFTYEKDAAEPMERVETRLAEELKARGFGVLSTIRVHEILHEKLGARIDPLVLFDVCSPRHALEALRITRGVATLLPCKVALSEEAGQTRLILQRPALLLAELLPHPELRRLGDEVERLLTAAVDAAAAPAR